MIDRSDRTRRLRWLAVAALLSGCAGMPEAPYTQHLVDLLDGDGVEILDSAAPTAPPRARWRFDEPGSGEAGLGGGQGGAGL